MRIRNAPGRRSDIWLKSAAELSDAGDCQRARPPPVPGGVAGKDHSVELTRGERVSAGHFGGDPHESFVCVYLNN